MSQQVKDSESALTLVEVIIAALFAGVIVMAAMSVTISAQRFTNVSGTEAALQNELSLALDHIGKQVYQVIGTIDDPGIRVGTPSPPRYYKIRVRIDADKNGLIDGTDGWAGYRLNSASNQLEYWPDVNAGAGGFDVVANRVTDFQANIINSFILNVNITGVYDPARPVGRDNPEVELRTIATPRSMSVR